MTEYQVMDGNHPLGPVWNDLTLARQYADKFEDPDRIYIVSREVTGADAETVEIITDEIPVTGFVSAHGWRETPVRETVGIISREYLSYGADGGDWFGMDEPYSNPGYGWQYEKVTAHLHGFSPDEERAVIRMCKWLDRRNNNR